MSLLESFLGPEIIKKFIDAPIFEILLLLIKFLSPVLFIICYFSFKKGGIKVHQLGNKILIKLPVFYILIKSGKDIFGIISVIFVIELLTNTYTSLFFDLLIIAILLVGSIINFLFIEKINIEILNFNETITINGTLIPIITIDKIIYKISNTGDEIGTIRTVKFTFNDSKLPINLSVWNDKDAGKILNTLNKQLNIQVEYQEHTSSLF